MPPSLCLIETGKKTSSGCITQGNYHDSGCPAYPYKSHRHGDGHGPDTVTYGLPPGNCIALLVSNDATLEGILRQTIGGELGRVPVIRRHSRLGQALDAGWQERIDFAVIDLRELDEDEAGLLGALIAQMPDMPLVVLCEKERSGAIGALLGESAYRRIVDEPIGAENIQLAIRDVLLRRPAQDRRRPPTFDPDDRLPYPSVLMDRIKQSIVAQPREGTALAVLVVDLKPSDHVIDDELDSDPARKIGEVGQQLLGALGNGDTVSYLGENRFAILAPTITDRGHAVLVAEGLLAALTGTGAGLGEGAGRNVTVGIAMFPDHGKYPGLLLRRATETAAEARHLSNGYSIYASGEAPRNHTPTVLASDFRDAVSDGGLVLHYQPLSDLRTGRTIGVEALVRWQHPIHGLLGPGEFVPMAEQTGLVLGMTLRILDDAVRQCANWHRAGYEVMVTVNLSPQSIYGINLPEIVQRTLTRYGLPPSGLALEITEHALITDMGGAGDVLLEIEAMGVQVIIDDFGIGYSSLALLRRLPVSAIKIDLSFVRTIEEDDQDAAMVMSIIDLGHNLGLEVIAEGVETATIWNLLAAHGCDTAQGFYVGRPIPAQEVDLAKTVPGARAAALSQRKPPLSSVVRPPPRPFHVNSGAPTNREAGTGTRSAPIRSECWVGERTSGIGKPTAIWGEDGGAAYAQYVSRRGTLVMEIALGRKCEG